MEPTVDGWRDELHKYFRSIEKTSESAFKRIKRDRSRNNLPFDDAFVDFILKRIGVRVTNVYKNLLSEDILEDELNLLNQNVNHQNDGNVRGLGLSNTSVNTTLGQNNNQMSDKMVITTPANQLPSAVPLKREDTENSEQELRTHRCIRPELPEKVDVKMESKMEIACELVTDIPVVKFDPNKDAEKPNTNGSEMVIMKSSLTGAHRPKGDKPFKQIGKSNKHQVDTIDLTLDQEETIDSKMIFQNAKDQAHTQTNARRQNVYAGNVAGSSKENEKFAFSSHYGRPSALNISISQNRNLAQPSAAIRSKNADGTVPSGNNLEMISMKNAATSKQQVSNTQRVAKGTESISSQSQPAIQQRQKQNYGTMKSNGLARRVDVMKRYKCGVCEYSTEWKCNLQSHIRIHTGERPFECKICDKRFIQKSNLFNHMKTHGNVFQFQCLNCRKGFAQEKPWKVHKSRCMVKCYDCYLCSMRFYQHKNSLMMHMRHKHTGEKPLGCSDCRKRFCQKSQLIRHMKRKH